MSSQASSSQASDIAIVGMAGRFPGAADVTALWRNLRDGVESITRFSDEELEAAGVDPRLRRDPSYVPARAVLDDPDRFDAAFFNITPRDATLMDPQHRLFLETAWSALEDAACDPEAFQGRIGVFAGSPGNSYALLGGLASDPREFYAMVLQNGADTLTTRVAYKLNLTGPALTVLTACSTSLVAVHLACQSLLLGECDMALAGGVSLVFPMRTGYLYERFGILSPDGHCRPFDAAARGTVPGNGVAAVVLRRLEDALENGDPIYAVIKGSAINNDGSDKVGFTAPGVNGQARVIAEAYAIAGIDPATVRYVEAHGTATAIGDPIEISALTEVFGRASRPYCALGAVKSNLGHLDAAAGATGLIKAALALRHREIPPTLHFERPNPGIDFNNSPFYVNTRLEAWPERDEPRRAGVSSFGVGGTNAHVVVEEAPPVQSSPSRHKAHLFVLSARSTGALDQATGQLADHLEANPSIELADLAFTLQRGRRGFPVRRACVASSREELIERLRRAEEGMISGEAGDVRPVVFMFPGYVSQYVNMGRQLYEQEPVFREQVDACARHLLEEIGCDIRTILFPAPGETERAAARLEEIAIAQPALFTVEYALARLWMDWGVKPRALVGHSTGEYAAACVAGVLSLRDALFLVATRSRLMQRLPPTGAMIAASLSREELEPMLPPSLSIAIANGPMSTVVSGPAEEVQAFEATLSSRGIAFRKLRAVHAYHSPMMEPLMTPFREAVRRVTRGEPQIPYLSNLTGTWITAEQTRDVDYWVQHMRQTVRFGDAVAELGKLEGGLLVEVGPGHTLASLVRMHPALREDARTLTSLPGYRDEVPEMVCLLEAVGALWTAGVPVDWSRLYADERRRRLSLPTYPFERRRYWRGGEREARGFGTPADAVGTAGGLEGASAHAGASAAHEGGAGASGLEPRTSGSRPATSTGHSRPFLRTAYVEPRDEMERKLAGVWQSLFGFDRVGVDDDFFALGGNSLLAVRMIARIGAMMGLELPIQSVLEGRTIARIAPLLEASRESAVSSRSTEHTGWMVRLKHGTRPQPLFIFPGYGGTAFLMHDLATLLEPDRAVLAFHARGLREGETPFVTVEETARAYLQEMRAIQERGPYLLLGYSYGGVVAYEVAQQLRAAGEEVGLIGMLDTPVPGGVYRELDHAEQIYWLSSRDEALTPERLRPLDHEARMVAFLERMREKGVLPAEMSLDQVRRYFAVWEYNAESMRTYRPQPFSGGPVVFFLARELDDLCAESPEQGWFPLADDGVLVFGIEGSHRTLLEPPHVADLATKLRRVLARVERQAGSRSTVGEAG